jgi:hypothetical protein
LTPELALELFKAGGIPLLVLALVLFNKSKAEKADPPKDDPAAKLASEMRGIGDRLIRIETLLEGMRDK